jgi:hypothetical protein
VHDVLRVAVVEGHEDLSESSSCHGFSEKFFSNDAVEKLSTGAELSDQIDVSFVLKVLVKLDYVGVVLADRG